MSHLKTALGPWCPLGVSGSSNAQVFAIGDIHGQADLLEETLSAIRKIPRTKAIRRVVFTGDLIDRGPESIKTISLSQKAGELADLDDVVILPGNHELMLLDGINDPVMYLGNWLDNGGEALIDEAQPGCKVRKLVKLAEIARNAVGEEFLDQMRNRPTWHAEGDLLFVHAGIDPMQNLMSFLELPRLLAFDVNHWAWIREPFLKWNRGWGGRVIVHGHTPAVESFCGLKKFTSRADRVSLQQRLCLDAGAAFLPQLGWAEFSKEAYRLCLTSNPNNEDFRNAR